MSLGAPAVLGTPAVLGAPAAFDALVGLGAAVALGATNGDWARATAAVTNNAAAQQVRVRRQQITASVFPWS